jgi:hypothetical protein
VLAAFLTGLILFQARGRTEGPVQPIEYSHWQHVTKPEGPKLECTFCHENADKSPHATVPNVSKTCMACHVVMMTESPEVQKLTAIAEKNEQPDWVRVYYFDKSANVYFNHKPHIRAKIDCTECHGKVGEMQRVRREVEHTMGWCMDCHQKSGASNDCYICHR